MDTYLGEAPFLSDDARYTVDVLEDAGFLDNVDADMYEYLDGMPTPEEINRFLEEERELIAAEFCYSDCWDDVVKLAVHNKSHVFGRG